MSQLHLSPSLLFIVLGVLLVIGVVVIFHALRRNVGPARLPYQKQEVLFSPAERSFFGVLTMAAGENYQVFGKVRVADVISVIRGLDRKEYLRAFNKISAKHFDYILCKRDSLEVVCVVELDDRSHENSKRRRRDDFLEQVCQVASLPLYRVPARKAYVVSEVQNDLAQFLGGAAPETTAPNLAFESTPFVRPEPTESSVFESAPACRKCGLLMARRQFKSGPNIGKEFWGCTGFPKCRGISAI